MNETIQVRTDLLRSQNLSLVARGLFVSVLAGDIDAKDTRFWWKSPASNQIKDAVNHLIATGFVSDKGGKLIFHEKPQKK